MWQLWGGGYAEKRSCLRNLRLFSYLDMRGEDELLSRVLLVVIMQMMGSRDLCCEWD